VLSTTYLVAFLVLALLVGILLSLAAVALEEVSFRRHRRWPELVRMVWWSIWENLGYRQLTAVWRVLGLWDALRRTRGWGAQKRRGFAPVSSPR
jgi:hypothetical protein